MERIMTVLTKDFIGLQETIDKLQQELDKLKASYQYQYNTRVAVAKEVMQLRAQNTTMKAMLKEIEWVRGFMNEASCLHCYRLKSEGHKSDCELNKLLKEEI